MSSGTGAADPPLEPGAASQPLNLSPRLQQALCRAGLARPSPLQVAAIRSRAQGRDCLLLAPKGAGKTTALLVAALDHLLPAAPLAGAPPQWGPPRYRRRVLVVCPSRTHARAAGTIAQSLGADCGVLTAVVHRGGSASGQAASLASASLVVGTPDRLRAQLRAGALRLDGLDLLILDDADEVLSLGLGTDVSALMASLPADRRTMMAADTLVPELLPHALHHLRDPGVLEFGPI